jgi:glycerol-3-phosphate dehydrogenase
VGPDAYEQPFREDFSTNAERIRAIMEKHLTLIKGCGPGDVIAYFAGIRAATYEEDFIIEKSASIKNLVHAAGIQSPGLAAAPAIAQDIVKITVGILNQETPVKTNSSFNPIRRRRPNLKNMTLEEKQEIIRQNPDYGIVVCRCEGVSRGEVLDAIRSPLPALSLDAVKRRVRPGMGRCQGRFCSPQILKLIAQEAKTADSAVTKSGGESRILLGETKGDTDERSL